MTTYKEAGESQIAEKAEIRNGDRGTAVSLNRGVHWLSRHWLLAFLVLWAGFNLLPWLAPVFMNAGWDSAGRAIYTIYTLLCHQLPQRSIFLFGERPMYELSEVQAAWQNTANPVVLREFVGNPEMGWKVAWSDRMVSLYTGILLWVLVLGPWRRRLPRLPLWGFALLALPMVVDGGTHMLSDMIGGIGAGFRYDNAWLASLTNHAFAAGFYGGDGLGSFNSWMRLISGLLFSLGGVWFVLPVLENSFARSGKVVEQKLERAGLSL